MDYKATLHLPQTAFEMRANLAQKEPRLLQAWQDRDLYGSLLQARQQAPTFVLHDGPPYANGALHHGHILNKVLKDIVVRDRSMAGFYVPYVPGWDCHGLPIEVQVDKNLGARKKDLSQAEFRAACATYAQRYVEEQRHSFRRLGGLGHWEKPYLTMQPSYEASVLREFGKLLASGLVYKGLRPVNWCLVHQTALAEAEVEYEMVPSPSLYVALRLLPPDAAALALVEAATPPAVLPPDVDLIIWTTTPWSLAANRAVAVHPEFTYVLYPVNGRLRLLERSLAAAVLAALGAPPWDASLVAGEFVGAALVGWRYQHPFLPQTGVVLPAAYVTQSAGTGCVHIAPAHGADDFALGKRYHLELGSPLQANGVFDASAGVFAGSHMQPASLAITAALAAQGALLSKPAAQLQHRYPHCWRCHQPLVIRATEQWFVAMDQPFGSTQQTLRQRALASLAAIEWIPSWGAQRLQGMLSQRPDWCLSRQRAWGVPLVVIYCTSCQAALARPELVERVATCVARDGAGAWFTRDVQDLLGSVTCPHCGGTQWRKESDILDVWFDSGVSYAAVVEAQNLARRTGNSEAATAPAIDLVLEGSDQHRGWFQATLLCALATRQQLPYKAVLTHGFVVDGAGKKIAKSKGNFIDPFKQVEQDGAELLRLWVAGENYRDDVRLSSEIMTRLRDSYRKLRNTLRFLLGNLHDFKPANDALTAAHLAEIDLWMLGQHGVLLQRVRDAMQSYQFHSAVQALLEFCSVDLSAFYLDILKDRLYAAPRRSAARRSAQTVLYVMARDLLRLLAPILCFTSDEAWGYLPKLGDEPSSVHLMLYPGVAADIPLRAGGDGPRLNALREAAAAQHASLQARYTPLRELRRQVYLALESARQQKTIGSSVQAAVHLQLPAALQSSLAGWSALQLADFLIVSAASWQPVAADAPLRVDVTPAAGEKCARCWLYRQEVGHNVQHPQLCQRCVEALADAT